jgi:tetratricopeptide (TPR) repeat protein
MYNIWPLLIISIAFLVIIFIVLRHFPALAVLDVENIPEEKEQQTKEKIIKQRMKRKISFLEKFFNNISAFLNNIFNRLSEKLKSLQEEKKQKKEEIVLSEVSPEEKIKILFSQVDDLIKKEDWDEAEKKLIEIISVDDKNFLAFWRLGEVYHLGSKYQEAKQTLLYALKLSEIFVDSVSSNDIANLNYSLALINQELVDLDSAVFHLEKSLELDPNNPRYLDLMLNLCIIKKDKFRAEDFLNRIKEVNPENNNISDWGEQIKNL